jgi:hypothetical protein
MLTRSLDNTVLFDNALTNVTVSFDVCGNCYLSVLGSKDFYQINIDNKDEIYLEQEIYNSTGSTKLETNRLIQTEDGKDKMLDDGFIGTSTTIESDEEDNYESDNEEYSEDEESEEENNCNDEENDEDDDEDDYVEDEEEKKERYKKEKLMQSLFPEQSKYRIENKLGNKSKRKFTFASTKSKIKIHKKGMCNTLALYESIMYDESLSVIFKSSADNYILYRLNIYNDGRLVFRPIGGMNKHYAVTIKDDVPSLFRI